MRSLIGSCAQAGCFGPLERLGIYRAIRASVWLNMQIQDCLAVGRFSVVVL